jgi:two-component system nitrate/nitrite response regulator NarL
MVRHPARSVILLEDNEVHARLLVEAVGKARHLSVGHLFHTGDALRRYWGSPRTIAPDLLVVDLHLPDASGLDILTEARVVWPDVLLLVVSALTDDHHVVEAIRRGAAGYLVKGESSEALALAFERVLGGQYPISPSIARHLIAQVRASGPAAPASPSATEGILTARECDILRCIASGSSYGETAETLGIALSTVETHIRSLYRKLEAHSKVQALNNAKRLGFVA